jgi:hypothetical protein
MVLLEQINRKIAVETSLMELTPFESARFLTRESVFVL